MWIKKQKLVQSELRRPVLICPHSTIHLCNRFITPASRETASVARKMRLEHHSDSYWDWWAKFARSGHPLFLFGKNQNVSLTRTVSTVFHYFFNQAPVVFMSLAHIQCCSSPKDAFIVEITFAILLSWATEMLLNTKMNSIIRATVDLLVLMRFIVNIDKRRKCNPDIAVYSERFEGCFFLNATSWKMRTRRVVTTACQSAATHYNSESISAAQEKMEWERKTEVVNENTAGSHHTDNFAFILICTFHW